ncbi:3-methyl-2-oxobutanoate hydroxymethyltransferase [bacterium]|nr:3-methyl-2-oxobutanoate hydroxymethyltransferase [bacterium]
MSYAANSEQSAQRKKRRVTDILSRKGGAPLTALTCYDATFARLLEKTDLDVVLVGDSLGHVMQGGDSTLTVTVDDVAYHTRCVAKSLKTPLLVSDVPFASAGFTDERLYADAERLMRAGAEALKIEGASAELCRQISRLTTHGIPVMGHIGLVPQSVHALGGYRIQGRSEEAQLRLLDEAQRLVDAGCFAIVLELVDEATARRVTQSCQVPTIGIGAGNSCDGQILVLQDMLGMNMDFKPKFLKHFANLENVVVDAVENYCREVNERSFPVGK